jgi:hypothetical protein
MITCKACVLSTLKRKTAATVGADDGADEPLLGHQGGLLQGSFHRGQRGDRHPVCVRLI